MWLWLLCISSHGCFPVKSPNYFSAEAPSHPLLNLPFKAAIIFGSPEHLTFLSYKVLSPHRQYRFLKIQCTPFLSTQLHLLNYILTYMYMMRLVCTTINMDIVLEWLCICTVIPKIYMISSGANHANQSHYVYWLIKTGSNNNTGFFFFTNKTNILH